MSDLAILAWALIVGFSAVCVCLMVHTSCMSDEEREKWGLGPRYKGDK